MGTEGLVVLEEHEDGRLSKLDKGVTTAKRVFLQARFPRREESVSLRVHWTGEEGAERTFSVGDWSGGSAARKGRSRRACRRWRATWISSWARTGWTSR